LGRKQLPLLAYLGYMMEYDSNSLGIINHAYPAFLNDPQIKEILDDFARYSGLKKFYLAGGFIIDKIFYPERPSNDIDLTVYGYEHFDRTVDNLKKSGAISGIEEFSRNLISTGKYIGFNANGQNYDIVFLSSPMFSGLVSSECPLIEYPSGHLIEQGPNIKSHQEKTIEFTRPIEFENKQVVLGRFIHSICKYDFPLTNKQNQIFLSVLRESFDHRDEKELSQTELNFRDKELITRINTAKSRHNQRWQELKENLVQKNFEQVLSKNIWQKILIS
jgi:hypothetical protein